MGTYKVDTLSIGRGSLSDNTNSITAFSSNNSVGSWSSATTYAQYNCVEYSNKVYRSKIVSNTNNQPDISPNQWETVCNTKDGDIAFIIANSSSTVMQRVGSVWSNIGGSPATISLNDGQLTPATAITFVGLSKAWAQLEYTVRRGSGHSRKRHGTMNILNDTVVTDVVYDHQFQDIGSDVNVTLTPVASAGNVALQYISTAESVAIELKWNISKGWT